MNEARWPFLLSMKKTYTIILLYFFSACTPGFVFFSICWIALRVLSERGRLVLSGDVVVRVVFPHDSLMQFCDSATYVLLTPCALLSLFVFPLFCIVDLRMNILSWFGRLCAWIIFASSWFLLYYDPWGFVVWYYR